MRSEKGWSYKEEVLFEVRSDSFMSRELDVVVLSDLISVLNSSIFVFIFASSYVFYVSILVLSLLLDTKAFMLGCCKIIYFLSW